MKLKGCPLLVQSDTHPSMLRGGESYTRTYMIPCVGRQCVAFSYDYDRSRHYCKKYGNDLEIHEYGEEDKHV